MTTFLTGDELASYLGVDQTPTIDKIVELTTTSSPRSGSTPRPGARVGHEHRVGCRRPGGVEPEGAHVVDPVVGRHHPHPTVGVRCRHRCHAHRRRESQAERRAAQHCAERGAVHPVADLRLEPLTVCRPVELLTDAEIAEDRAMAVRHLPDVCKIERTIAGPWRVQRDHRPVRQRRPAASKTLIYQGPCKFQIRADINANIVEPVEVEREWAYQTSTLLTPVDGTRSGWSLGRRRTSGPTTSARSSHRRTTPLSRAGCSTSIRRSTSRCRRCAGSVSVRRSADGQPYGRRSSSTTTS
jgi:hypothetical protein